MINIINGYVYVSLGTRDGALAGDRIEVLGDNGVAVGVLELDLCGEVICRAPLPNGLVGKLSRGMPARVAKPSGESMPKPAPVVPTHTPEPPAPSAPSAEEPIMGPDVIPYREPIPRGYVLKRKPYSGLVTLGWVGFSISYGITALVGLADDDQAILLLPVLGPLLHLATENDYYSKPKPEPYVISSLLQGASLLSLIAGYSGEKTLVRIGSSASVSIAPVMTREGGYFGVVGRF